MAVCACILTVSIVGSIMWLSWRAYERHEYRGRVRSFVSSLENRTDQELDDVTQKLRVKKKLARYVLPQLLETVRGGMSERQRIAAIRVCSAFLDKNRIRTVLVALATDAGQTETVAGNAVMVLSEVEPPERAAELLGRCLSPPPGQRALSTVVDEACAGLLRLGEPGRREAERRVPALSEVRRLWLVGFVGRHGAENRESWLEMLNNDESERVRAAAAEALRTANSETDPSFAG